MTLFRVATFPAVVDPEEASVRVNSLKNQLEMSHALTAQIQNLSILNYL